MYRTAAVALSIMLVAPALAADQAPKTIALAIPSPGQVVTASVGDPIYQNTGSSVLRIVKPSQSIKITSIGGTFAINAGDVMDFDEDGPDLVACGRPQMSFGLMSATYRCFRDMDKDGKFDRTGKGGLGVIKDVAPPVPYTFEDIPVGADVFRTSLIYTGMASGALRLSYREFKNGMARVAFTEDLSIPLNTSFPQPVVVKGIRFLIHKIDGTGMQYEVVSARAG